LKAVGRNAYERVCRYDLFNCPNGVLDEGFV